MLFTPSAPNIFPRGTKGSLVSLSLAGWEYEGYDNQGGDDNGGGGGGGKGRFPGVLFVFLCLDGSKASGDEQTAAFRYIVGKEGGGT